MTQSRTRARRNKEVRNSNVRNCEIELDIEEGLRNVLDPSVADGKRRRTARRKKITQKEKIRWLWKNTPFRRSQAKVYCEREWHDIIITEKGRFVAVNHVGGDLDSQLALKSLGSRLRCRCLTVKINWLKICRRKYGGAPVAVPPDLQMELVRAGRRKTKRKLRNRVKWDKADQLSVPFQQRSTVLAKVLKKELEKSELFRSPNSLPTESVTVRVLAGDHTKRRKHLYLGNTLFKIHNGTEFKMRLPLTSLPEGAEKQASENQTKNRGASSWYYFPASVRRSQGVRLSADWWDSIYKQGMAVVDGCIVTQVSVEPVTPANTVSKPSSTPTRPTKYAQLVRIGSSKPHSLTRGVKHSSVMENYIFWRCKLEQNDKGEWHVVAWA